MGITEIWSIVAVILHFAGIGAFAEWPVIAGPFTWSCLTIEMWVFILYIVFFLLCIILAAIRKK